MDRRTFAKLAGAATFSVTSAGFAAPSRPSRRAEARALVRFAETTHPRGLEAMADPHWRRLADRFIASSGASEPEYVARALELLGWFKDAHTTLWVGALEAGPFGLQLPVRASVFFDGLHVVEAAPEHRALLAGRVESVGGLPINTLIQRFAAIWPSGNVAWPHHDAGLLLATPGLLHSLGVVRGPAAAGVPIEVANGSSRHLRANLTPAAHFDRINMERVPAARETWAAEAGGGNYVRRLPDRQALYLSLDDVSVSGEQFMPFLSQLFAAMNEPRWTRLIIDLRRNPGGNNFLIEPLRKEIGRSRFNRPGGLYVLIGPTTFSAAQNLVNRLERDTFAIFAGEPTGGAPRHYGDSKPFSFPGTILKGGVSTIPWFDSYPMDERPWVMPDLLIPRTFADWSAGRDRVLDAVLAHSTDAPADTVSRENIFYFRRRSQSAEWKPFWLS